MKKFLLTLPFLFIFSIWCAEAQITTYPYLEDFESGDGGWIVDNTTAGTWAIGAPAAAIINSADSGANAWVTNLTGDYNTNESSFVVSPIFDLSTLNAPSIEMSVWWNSEFSWDGMVLQSSIDGGTSWQNVGANGDPNNWYNDGTIAGEPGGQQEGWTGRVSSNNGSAGWVIARHALIGLGGESSVTLRVAFGSDGSVEDEGVAFDTVSIFDVVCPEPFGLIAENITATTVDISWTAGGGEMDWEIVVQPAGTGFPSGAGTPTQDNPYVQNGLAPVTDYEIYLRSDCGIDGVSNWTGPLNFQTGCAIFIPDYLESFGTIIPSCWDEAGNGDATTGPIGLGAGDWNADGYLNVGLTGAYKINLWQAAKSDWILSPQFDLTGGPFQVDFNFGIMTFGSSTNAGTLGSDDTVQLLISTDNGATWTSLITYDNTSVVPASGTQAVFDLTAYAGQIVQFGILGSEGTVDDPEDNDVFVDNFRVRAIPDCPEPIGLLVSDTGVTTVDFTWTAGAGEMSWEYAVISVGTGPPTAPGTNTNTNTIVVTDLEASTNYEIWVRSICEDGSGFSSWTGPIEFTTLNMPPPPPVGVTCVTGTSSFIFTENFDQDPPAGWTGTGFDGTDGNWDITAAGANSFNTGPENAYDGGTGTHLEYEAGGSATATASAISPAIDLTVAIDGAELSFFFHAFGDDIGTLNVGVSNSATGPFTNEFSWVGELQLTDAEAWVPVGINLDAYLGQVIYLEFNYGGAGTGFEGDMSIDFIRVESCGDFCIPPSGITIANITGTSADISWTANNGETSWEYVIVTSGTGEPSGPGITVATPSANISELEFQTDYEVWVRADCGIGTFSIWSGPSNFTTTIQTNFDVDCAVGPTNNFICYGNNDSEIFTYTSSDGSLLNLTINNGEIEGAPFDFLLVTDGNGTVIYNDEGNDGVLDGLTFQSLTDTITIQILSDGSVSCEAGSGCCLDGIDFTVACATCINPTATFQVVDDCDAGDQFLIDVNITNLGDATSLTISNNIDATTVPVTAVGTYQIGPFPFLVDVVVTVSNDQDVNCVINSSPIQLLACPPENDNPCDAIVALVNDGFLCEVSTAGSIIEATPSGIADPSCGSSADDDVWFQFVAESEFHLIALANIAGSTTNDIDHSVYEGTCDNLTEISCVADFAELSSVTPQLTIGDTYFIRIYSGGTNSETTTFDLCITPYNAPLNLSCDLAEDYCSGSDDSDILYSYNTINVVPGFGAVDCLFTTPNPTFSLLRIAASGDILLEMVQNTAFDQNDNPIGDELDVDFILWGPYAADDVLCDSMTGLGLAAIVDCSYSFQPVENVTLLGALEDEIYLLLITNFEAEAGVIQVRQTNVGESGAGTTIADIEVDLGPDQSFCGIFDYTISANVPSADTFEWYEDGFIIAGETGSTLTVNSSNTYTVIAYNDGCDAQAQDSVTVTFSEEPVINPVDDIITCDDGSADEIEDFDLSIQTPIILGSQSETDFNVTYHLTLNDATNDVDPLPLIYTNISNPQTIYIRIENSSDEGCQDTTSFDLIISGPTPTATSVPLEVCDDDTDGFVDFDLAAHSVNVLDGQSATDVTVSYYTSEANAETATDAITLLYTSTTQVIWVRVESNIAFDCFTVVPIELIVKPSPSTSFTTDFDYEVCPNATVPVLITATANNYSESDVTIVWYRDGGVITGETSLTLSVLEAGLYEIEVTFNDDTQCSNTIAQNIIELETCVFPEGISPNGDGRNDTFDLSSYNVSKLEIFNRNGSLVYSKTSYTDEWFGQTNDGDELPVGTYFYTMEYENGKQRTAWVYIQRLN